MCVRFVCISSVTLPRRVSTLTPESFSAFPRRKMGSSTHPYTRNPGSCSHSAPLHKQTLVVVGDATAAPTLFALLGVVWCEYWVWWIRHLHFTASTARWFSTPLACYDRWVGGLAARRGEYRSGGHYPHPQIDVKFTKFIITLRAVIFLSVRVRKDIGFDPSSSVFCLLFASSSWSFPRKLPAGPASNPEKKLDARVFNASVELNLSENNFGLYWFFVYSTQNTRTNALTHCANTFASSWKIYCSISSFSFDDGAASLFSISFTRERISLTFLLFFLLNWRVYFRWQPLMWR